MKLYIERNDVDSTMLNLYSIKRRPDGTKKYILWSVVHEDMLEAIDEEDGTINGFLDGAYSLILVPKLV